MLLIVAPKETSLEAIGDLCIAQPNLTSSVDECIIDSLSSSSCCKLKKIALKTLANLLKVSLDLSLVK